MRIYRYLFAVMMVISLFSGKRLSAQDINYKAYSVYVYNFIKYIEWPSAQKRKEFVIAVVGDSPISKELKVLAATKQADGKPIVIRQYKSIEEVGECDILYLSASRNGQLKDAVERMKGKSALLIAEREGMVKKGAGINFVRLEDDTLKFEVNRKVIEEHNLKISNTLVSLALK